MARTETYTNCPCCGSSSSSTSRSGSTSGSRSGSGSDTNCTGWYCCRTSGTVEYIANCQALADFRERCGISRMPACGGKTIPSVLYIAFTGALSSFGTLRLDYVGVSIGCHEWTYNSGGAPPAGNSCVTRGPVSVSICATPGCPVPEGKVQVSIGTLPDTGCAQTRDNAYDDITSYAPFTAAGGGTFGEYGFGTCPCEGERFDYTITGGPNDIDPSEVLTGPYDTQAEAIRACSSSSSSNSNDPCCPNGRSLPAVFTGAWEQTAGAGSPNSGTMTFTYNDGTGPGAFLGAGWYSDTWYLSGTDPKTCEDDYFAVYRCVVGPTGVSRYQLRVYNNSGAYYDDYGAAGAPGVWTSNGPEGECTGAEQIITLPFGIDCEDTSGTGDGGGLMARRADPVGANLTTAAVVGKFALPLCKYEGSITDFAACSCEGKHVRNCDNPFQGMKDPQGRDVPEIDQCQREYVPESRVQNCERCPYRMEP